MKPFLTKVTVTGADDSVTPSDLESIAREFPFVEFAILLSCKSQGKHRFPSDNWLDGLAAHFWGSDIFTQGDISFAGHICGTWVQEIFTGDWPWPNLNVNFSGLVSRWQLNTHGISHQYVPQGLASAIEFQNARKREVIFQYDQQNTAPLMSCVNAKLNVSALFDLSHGTGTLPNLWPTPLANISCGYAGGLSPSNVSEQLSIIETLIGNNTVWIDAETHLRSDDGRFFDLQKVRAFLSASKPWVIEHPQEKYTDDKH